MRKGWEIKKLGVICENLDSKRIPITQSKRNKGEYPYYGASGIVDYVADYIFDDDLLLVSEDGANLLARTYPIAFPISGKVWVNNHAHVLKFESSTKQKFVEYYLNSIKLDAFVSGMAQPKLNQSMLNSIPIPIPPTPEQQRIVSILDEAFEVIEQAKANTEKNLQNARELFQSELNSIFTNKGEGWVEKSLGEIATFRNGMNFTKQSSGESIKLVGVKDFQKRFWIDLENIESVTIDGSLNEIDCLKENDILTVRSNGNPELIGRCMLAGPVAEKTSHSGFTIRIRLSSKDYFPPYLCHYLKSEKAKSELIESGTGISIRSLNQVALSSLVIPAPKIKDQQRIVNQLDILSIETKQLEENYRKKLESLEELKKSVLQKAFSGELTANL